MRLRDFDLPLLVSVLALCILGLLMVYSATQTAPRAGTTLWSRQLLWFLIGLAALGGAVIIPFRLFDAYSYLIYSLMLPLLVIVLAFEHPSGARRWLEIGGFGFQPSEIAKGATCLALAKFLSGRQAPDANLKRIVVPLVLTLVPLGLILIEPDLGTSGLFFVLLLVLLYWAGLTPLYVFYLVSPLLSVVLAFSLPTWSVFILALLASFFIFRVRLRDAVIVAGVCMAMGVVTPLAWKSLKDYQRDRILVFIHPDLDPRGAGWHVLQSKIAIGSGGLWGKGYLQGTQKKLAFLPEQHTDFIFSTLGEEFGLLGAVAVLGLYTIVITRGIKIAREARNPFGSLLAAGLVAVLAYHVFLNIGMTVGILPITGIPLPFLSYGGSALFCMLVAVGVLLNIGLRRYEY
jgi:rod shape determining protein RodA